MTQPTSDGPHAYRPELSRLWWLGRRSYVFFVLRELSSIFVAWSVVFLLLLVRALAQGESQYRDFLDWAASPWVVALNVVTLAFLVLHAVTWFNLTPAATVVKLRGQRVPPAAIAGGAYVGWVVVTALVVALVVTRQVARRTIEPVLWLLFSAGGVVSALFLPALIFLFALAIPVGWIDAPGRDQLLGLVGHPLTALVLLGLFVLSLLHWAQRFRYALFDGLKLKAHQRLINSVVYALALLGSLAAVVVLWQAVSARNG